MRDNQIILIFEFKNNNKKFIETNVSSPYNIVKGDFWAKTKFNSNCYQAPK